MKKKNERLPQFRRRRTYPIAKRLDGHTYALVYWDHASSIPMGLKSKFINGQRVIVEFKKLLIHPVDNRAIPTYIVIDPMTGYWESSHYGGLDCEIPGCPTCPQIRGRDGE